MALLPALGLPLLEAGWAPGPLSGLTKASGAFPKRVELMVDWGAPHWPEGLLWKQPESLQG